MADFKKCLKNKGLIQQDFYCWIVKRTWNVNSQCHVHFEVLPRVVLVMPLNSFLQSRNRKLDLPTAASPANTILYVFSDPWPFSNASSFSICKKKTLSLNRMSYWQNVLFEISYLRSCVRWTTEKMWNEKGFTEVVFGGIGLQKNNQR